MKKIKTLLLTALFFQGVLSAQNSWNLELNTLSSSNHGIGTANSFPLKFYTNNILRMTICSGGMITANAYSGSDAVRLLRLDTNGKFLPLSPGNAAHVLFGNGS